MKREFVTPVSMYCTSEQFKNDLHQKVILLGYDHHMYNFPQHSCVFCQYGILWSDKRKNSHEIHIEHYNPELFLALASMSKGPDHYPGEWVKYVNNGHLYQIVRKTYLGDYQVENGAMRFITQPSKLTKATKDEIVSWFTKDEALKSKSEPSGFNPDAGISMNNHSGTIISGCVKPPLGILPRKLHEETRIRDLMVAIDRHLTEGLNIPEKWQDELNDLLYSRVEREVEA